MTKAKCRELLDRVEGAMREFEEALAGLIITGCDEKGKYPG